MSTLEDRRPVAATTTSSNNPSVIGEDLAYLLVKHPDIELASIRLIPNDDGTVGIAGRRGPLTPTECPSCHTTAGHPHTDYCTLAPDRVWPDGQHPTGLHPLRPDCTAACWPEPAVGPPCYTLNHDGTTNAATQCVDPECRYPNPHTHPDLIAEP